MTPRDGLGLAHVDVQAHVPDGSFKPMLAWPLKKTRTLPDAKRTAHKKAYGSRALDVHTATHRA
eukprot:365291-Chlamydomonas_euryale.AAC.18